MNVIKGALAVAMFIGAVSPFEMNMKAPDTETMVDLKLKLSNPEEAARAHNQYEHSLTDFYDQLPKDGKYQKELFAKGEDLLACYTTWHTKTKNTMQYVDPATFTEYYEQQKASSEKRNTTAKADEKKKEEDPKKEEKTEEELTLAEGDKKEGDKEKKEDPKKDYFWAELDNLKNAGFAFDNHVQQSLMNLGAKTGELSNYWIFFPQALLEMEAEGSYDELEAYKGMATDKYKKEIEAYEAAVKALVDGRTAVKKMLQETKGIKEFFSDPKTFKYVWLRGFAKFRGMPSKEQFEDKLKVNKNNQYTPFLKKAVGYMEEVKESDRLDFNKKFDALLNLALAWQKAGQALDAKMLELEQVMVDHHTGKDVVKCSKFVTTAIKQRQQMGKVYMALQKLNSMENKAQKEAQDYQKDVTKENQANVAIWVILVLAILGTIGGVVYCKTQKKACFAEKEEEAAEGGETDKTLFKKEVKSKNSHKKHTKESLMPSFKVAEEQA